jgi:hypothetical protein
VGEDLLKPASAPLNVQAAQGLKGTEERLPCVKGAVSRRLTEGLPVGIYAYAQTKNFQSQSVLTYPHSHPKPVAIPPSRLRRKKPPSAQGRFWLERIAGYTRSLCLGTNCKNRSRPLVNQRSALQVVNKYGKPVFRKSYSVLQDELFEHMRDAGFKGFERGELGSTAEHLSSIEYQVVQEEARLEQKQSQLVQTEKSAAVAEKRRRNWYQHENSP